MVMVFEFIDGSTEEYPAGSVTLAAPHGHRTPNPTEEAIAQALEWKRAWYILKNGGPEIEKILNPHTIKSVHI